MKKVADQEIIQNLQKQILTLQGNRIPEGECSALALGKIESAFPQKIFPRGVIHEFISFSPQEASSTNGFISVVLGKLMKKNGHCIWISPKRKIFPPALKTFGIEPDRILFVDAWKLKETLWTIEESLKCDSLSAVIGEISELSFNDSRRLQLAVEKSKVTGFIHRNQPRSLNAVACVSRWKIKPVPGYISDKMPGVGFPAWEVELLKVRSGRPGKWLVQWSPQGLEYLSEKNIVPQTFERNTA